MEVFSLLRAIAIILPTLLTVVLPGLYQEFTEDLGGEEDEGLLQNNMEFSVSANRLLELFLYLNHLRSTALTEPNNSELLLQNSASVLPSIWSLISPNEYEEEEWLDEDTAPSFLTKAVCKDQGPYSFYFPHNQKATWSCRLVRGTEEFVRGYFWELVLPFVSLISAFVWYMLMKFQAFKRKVDRLTEFVRETIWFYPKRQPVQGIVRSRVEEVTSGTESEDELDDCEGNFEQISCQCDMCSNHLAAQILLKQRLEELEGTFF